MAKDETTKPSMEGIEGCLQKAIDESKLTLPLMRLSARDIHQKSFYVPAKDEGIAVQTPADMAKHLREGQKQDWVLLMTNWAVAILWEKRFVEAVAAGHIHGRNAQGLYAPRKPGGYTPSAACTEAKAELEKYYSLLAPPGTESAKFSELGVIGERLAKLSTLHHGKGRL